MWDAVADQLLALHHVRADPKLLCSHFGGSASASASASTSASHNSAVDVNAIYRHVLHGNLPDIVGTQGLLPRNAGSTPLGQLECSVMCQIQTARDATQPLRPCADMDEDEAALVGAAAQQSNASQRRLLRLTVTDGVTEVPAVELKTLRAFRGIPVPGEKVLLKMGTEIRNGMLILTDELVVPLGGSEPRLKEEFLLRRQRAMLLAAGGGQPKGMEGAPKFEPLEAVGMTLPHQSRPVPRQSESGKSGQPPSTKCHTKTTSAPQASRPSTEQQRPPHGRDNRHPHSRGGGSNGRGGSSAPSRGGGQRHHRDPVASPSQAPPPRSAPAPPKFTDADFPSLGGDW